MVRVVWMSITTILGRCSTGVVTDGYGLLFLSVRGI